MEKYKQYENAINERSWYYSKKYGVDFEDVKQEALLIFFKSILTYKEDKSSFVTYLYWNLKGLDAIMSKKYCNFNDDIEDYDFENSKVFNLQRFLDIADREISPEAMRILQYCCNYEYERINKRNPTRHSLMTKFGFKPSEFQSIWNELKKFWLDYGEIC